MNSEEERMMLYLTFGPTAKKFNFRHFGHPAQESEVGPTVKTSRSGRQIKEPLKKYMEWDGKSIRRGPSATLMDCNQGNSRVRELIERVRNSLRVVRVPVIRDYAVSSSFGRVMVKLKPKKELNKRIRSELESCKDETDIRTFLTERKMWKVTFREEEERENLVPGEGWCGYLSIDQVRRREDSVVKMDSEGIQHLKETLDDIIRHSRGGVRQNWRSLGSKELTTREVLFSVRDTLTNWGARLKNSLEKARWLNAKNIYGTCGIWGYSQWGTDPDDAEY
jgi:hypothetical protein